mmetsp:Transcript_106578/g.147550  ORF Transcript_106578/g.147550 Transcript_106578/m.147550 type:complete len:108 (-) Transcript_106578:19-342(-)
MARRSPIAFAVLALAAVAAVHLLSVAPGAFVSEAGAPRTVSERSVTAAERPDALALGAAAGLLTAQPAHAGMLFDEVIPYAVATSLSILWGIILGFVLLRLQEAFPE